MKENNQELLTSIYQNCQTAVSSIDDIWNAVEDENLKQELHSQRQKYDNFAQKCLDIAKNFNTKLPDNSIFEKAKLWTSIKMTTLTNKSTRHIAEMMLIGSVMGTLQCYKDLSDYKEADKSLLELCGQLLQLEENNFDNLKQFLKSA